MASPIPDDIHSRPRAASRYLGRGQPPWRITVLLQGARPLRRVHGDDLVLGTRPPEDLRPGRQPIWGISVVLGGSVTVHDRRLGVSHQLSAGGWFRFAGRPADELALSPGAGFSELAVSTDDGLGRRLDELGLWPAEAAAQADPEPGLAAIGWDLHRALLDPLADEPSLIRRLIQMIELVRHGSLAGGDGFAAEACRLLAAHPEPAFGISAAARALGLSEQVFRKRFRAAVGLPPGQWHQRRRMERAASLLATLPVAAVAARLGYDDPASFSRQFKRLTGSPPADLRGRR